MIDDEWDLGDDDEPEWPQPIGLPRPWPPEREDD
jgi:hypothetical protein